MWIGGKKYTYHIFCKYIKDIDDYLDKVANFYKNWIFKNFFIG